MAMENDWVIIASFINELNCHLAVERLAQEDIEAVIFDRRDSMYKIGEIDLFVHRDYVIKAKETIKDLV